MNKGNKFCNSTIPNFWQKSQPNGDRRENCVIMNNNDFGDLNCEVGCCGACETDKTLVFVMRGLCKDSKFDTHYGWLGELSKGNKYSFRGFSNSFLYWDHEHQYWKIEQNNDPSIYAISEMTIGPYPFGRNTWHFYNDSAACMTKSNKVEDNIYKDEVNFNSCPKSMFNCDDGTW